MPSYDFAVVCSSNMNRSMEAHRVFMQKGYKVHSYGAGSQVRLPGPSADTPNVYSFDTPYERIYNELYQKDVELYSRNGVLALLDRNRQIKKAPERWHDATRRHDVVIAFEERCWESILQDLQVRGSVEMRPVHIFNLDVRDSPEDAVVGASDALKLAELISREEDLDDAIPRILEEFERSTGHQLLHDLCFY